MAVNNTIAEVDMKKFLIVVSFVSLLIITYSLPVILPQKQKDIQVTYYTKGSNLQNSIYLYDDIYMTESDYCTSKQVANKLTNIVGISATFSGDYDAFKEVVKKCKVAVKAEENVDNIHIIYGISESCGKPIQANGENINFQIAIRDNVITVGTPLIMGSY